MTKDFVSNEIFRRVEPEGRTMGEYFKQEIQQKLNMDVYLKMDEADLAKSVNYHYVSMYKMWKNTNVPWEEGRYMTMSMGDNSSLENHEKQFVRETAAKCHPPKYLYDRPEIENFHMNKWNEKECKMGEIVSAACQASGRGLAKMAQFMANKGKVGDV